MTDKRLSFGSLEFCDDYVVCTIDLGVDLDAQKVDVLIESLNHHFGNRPFVYISNRIHDYSLNPTESKRLFSSTKIKAAAFVLVRKFSFESFLTEKVFYKIPTAVFPTVAEAVKWAKSLKTGQEGTVPTPEIKGDPKG